MIATGLKKITAYMLDRKSEIHDAVTTALAATRATARQAT